MLQETFANNKTPKFIGQRFRVKNELNNQVWINFLESTENDQKLSRVDESETGTKEYESEVCSESWADERE